MYNSIEQWESRIGRRLKLRDLQILSTVVRWGSMAKAATHLAMSQPAVSESIANLEATLRVTLLDRSPKGVSPTLYAHALLKRGHVIFDELMQGIQDIEFLANPTVGEVRVSATEMLVAGLLPAAIDRLSRHYPEITIQVVQANTDSLEIQELRERKVDLMLGRVPISVDKEDFDIETLFHDQHYVVVGESSPWARRRKIELAELVNEAWIFPSNQIILDLISAAFKSQGLERPKARVNANSILLRNHLLATGRFLTFLPDSVLKIIAKQLGLKILPIDVGTKARPVAIITLKKRTVSPVTQLFIEQIRAIAKTMTES
jgi:DNA-binding transcriptional LysR family regulator